MDDLKTKRVKPALAGGFNDFEPEAALVRHEMKYAVAQVFRQYGFVPLETPVVEFREVLVGQAGETEKEIFDLKARGDDKPLSLRFDLTVGLSRFVAAHPELELPFKRFQVGDVFRGEKPQAGRYRQFTQFDVDIVGSRSMMAEAEILAAMHQALNLFEPGPFHFRVNHRGLLEGLAVAAGIRDDDPVMLADRTVQMMRILDKLDKIGLPDVVKLLTEGPKEPGQVCPALSPEGVTVVRTFIGDPDAWQGNDEALRRAGSLVGDTPQGRDALADLQSLLDHCRLRGLPDDTVRIDLSVARGLDYYTGPVFETKLEQYPQWGSVMSGGRYDDLVARFSGMPVPAVGGSIGFDRLFNLLLEHRQHDQTQTPTQVEAVVMLFDDTLLPDCYRLVNALQQGGISAEIPIGNDRSFKGQMKFALKRNAHYLLIYGDQEQARQEVAVKNLRTRAQKSLPLSPTLAADIRNTLPG